MRSLLLMGALLLVACGDEKQKPVDDSPPKTEQGLETFGNASGTTESIFKKDGIKKLQEILNTEVKKVADELDAVLEDAGARPKNTPPKELEQTGELDPKTQRALGAWQKVHGLPETGLPDYETLDRLGLKPSDVFEHRPPGNRKTRKE